MNALLYGKINSKKFIKWLNDRLDDKNDKHDEYYHYGIDCNYGIELEFMSNESRYVIGSRINSCMMEQNNGQFLKSKSILDPGLNDTKNITADIITEQANDQWSMFMVESLRDHAAKTMRGLAECENIGSSGFKIEDDPSVYLDNAITGTKGWYASWSKADESKEALEDPFYNYKAGPIDRAFIDRLHQRNELVSPVLRNEPYEVPTIDGKKHKLPLGFVALDNMLNHMMNHNLRMTTQRTGLHVHLSYKDGYSNPKEKRYLAVGFLKLYYLFEPLFLAMMPSYRTGHAYCRIMQSIFTFDEILHQPITRLYKSIVNGIKLPSMKSIRTNILIRYVGLNFENLQEGGIDTIEWRAGSSTFDSKYIQNIIMLLQTLFMYNKFLYDKATAKQIDGLTYHNLLLIDCHERRCSRYRQKLFPDFVDFTNKEYNLNISPSYNEDSNILFGITLEHIRYKKRPDTLPIINQLGSPIWGVLGLCGKRTSKNIIVNLMNTFIVLTGSFNIFKNMLPYIQFFHSTSDNGVQYNDIDIINESDLEKQLLRDPLISKHMTPGLSSPVLSEHVTPGLSSPVLSGLKFKAISMFTDYLPKEGITNLLHECNNCYKDRGQCVNDYDMRPERVQLPHQPPPLPRQKSNVYDTSHDISRLFCEYDVYDGKTQTELIAHKRIPYNEELARKRSQPLVGGAVSLDSSYEPILQISNPNGIKTFGTNLSALKTFGTNLSALKTFGTNLSALKTLDPYLPVPASESKQDTNRGGNHIYEDNVRNYRCNAEAEKFEIIIKDDKVTVYHLTSFMSGKMKEPRLGRILTFILINKILNADTIMLLARYGYIDHDIFTTDTLLHETKLESELKEFKIDKIKINELQKVYREELQKYIDEIERAELQEDYPDTKGMTKYFVKY